MSHSAQHSSGDHRTGTPHQTPVPATPTHRVALIVTVLIVVIGGVVVGVSKFRSEAEPLPAPVAAPLAPPTPAVRFDPTIPSPDTSAMEPRVVALIRETAQAVRINLGNAVAWGQLGGVFDAHELLSEAEHCYRNAGILAPQDFRWQYLLAHTAEMLGRDPNVVIDVYQAAAALEPEFPPVFYRMGEAYARQGRLDEARAAYERALQFDATLAVAHRALAQVLMSQGDLDRSISHFNQAEALVPGDAAVYAGLAQAYLRRGDTVLSEQAAQRSRTAQRRLLALPDPVRYLVKSLGISSNLCFDRGQQHLQLREFAAAIADFKIVEEVRPRDPLVHQLLDRAYTGNGQPELARQHRLKAIQLAK